MLRCPSAIRSPWNGVNGPEKEATNYMINGVVGRWPSSPTLAQVPAPADIIYLQESYYYGPFSISRPLLGGGVYRYWHYSDPNSAYYCNGQSNGLPHCEVYNSTHKHGGNILYCDGHAKYMQYTRVRSGHFGLTPDEAWVPGLAQSTKAYNAAF